MVLKSEIVELDEGKKIEVTEISFAAQLRMAADDNVNVMSMFRECMSKEDFDYLEKINREEGKKIKEALSRLNKPKKAEDFTKKKQELKSGEQSSG